MEKGIKRALLFWIVFSGYAVAGEAATLLYTEQQMLEALAVSHKYTELLKKQIATQDRTITTLTAMLNKIYEPQMQVEASTGGSDVEETKKKESDNPSLLEQLKQAKSV